MRSQHRRSVTAAVSLPAALSFAGALLLVACSPSSNAPAASSSSQVWAAPRSSATQTPDASGAPPVIGVSAAGVTTSVNAPADSTEDEYFQACHAARLWMSARPGDPHTQIEPYLAMVQGAVAPGPGTFNSPWSQLTPERQSAVIVAVRAAADAACG